MVGLIIRNRGSPVSRVAAAENSTMARLIHCSGAGRRARTTSQPPTATAATLPALVAATTPAARPSSPAEMIPPSELKTIGPPAPRLDLHLTARRSTHSYHRKHRRHHAPTTHLRSQTPPAPHPTNPTH